MKFNGLVYASVLALASVTGRAETSFSDVVVNQRWPWSEKVDVDFTLTGDATDVDVYATWDLLRGDDAPGVTNRVLLGTLPGATPGVNRFTWDPVKSAWSGLTLTGFSVSLAVSEAETRRYLVIDLADGGVSYRATPDGANGRWSDAYKTTRMAFRRVPAGSYQLGMESNQIAKVAGGPINASIATAWSRHDVTFTGDFYVSVYKMTVAQYNLLKGWEPGSDMTPKALAYDEIRGSVAEGVNWPRTGYDVSPTSIVASVRAKAGPDICVDLCQECQWEAAMRAGRTTFWPNGGTMDDSMAALTNIVDEICWRGGTHDVGLKADNGWGIYDPSGNGPEWALDTIAGGYTGSTPKKGLSDGTDPVGASSDSPSCRVVRTDGAKSLHWLLPSYRRVYKHGESVAAARFCIHLKPLVAQ